MLAYPGGKWVTFPFIVRRYQSVFLHKFPHSFNCFMMCFGIIWIQRILYVSQYFVITFPNLDFFFTFFKCGFQNYLKKSGSGPCSKKPCIKKVHCTVSCIVILRIFHDRSLWATAQKMIKELLELTSPILIVIIMAPSPSGSSCSTSVILNPSPSFQRMGLVSYLKCHWWMFFPIWYLPLER